MTMEQALLNQYIPYSQEAEEATIGSVLVNPASYLDVKTFLKAEDFFILRHQYIWQALDRLVERGDEINYVTVVTELKNIGKLDDIGGPAYITQLINNTPTSIHSEVYGRLVERASRRRQLLSAADRIKLLALDEELEFGDVWIEAQQELDAIEPVEKERFLSGMESILYYDEVQAERHRKVQDGEMVAYPLPEDWIALREKIPAIYPGDFIVVSGRPGTGKSTLLEQWAEWCAGLGLWTSYTHTEMSDAQLLDRRMARYSQIPYHRLTLSQGPLTPEEEERKLLADKVIGKFAKKLAYHWMPDVQFARLCNQMRRDALRGVKVFFIDHFQDVEVEGGKNSNVVREYERACKWLAGFAEFRNVVVIVASQENDKGGTKWSGKLLEKALTRISIKSKELTSDYVYHYNGVEIRAFQGQRNPVSDILIGKARFGITGKVKMLQHGPGFKWVDLSYVRVRRAAAQEFNDHYTDTVEERTDRLQ